MASSGIAYPRVPEVPLEPAIERPAGSVLPGYSGQPLQVIA